MEIQTDKTNNKDLNMGELEFPTDQTVLVDSYGRVARKLRISLTDRCNMRCKYCMPQGNIKWFKNEDILTYDEIFRLVVILTNLGINKIRLTGGEPLLRPKLEDLVASLRRINAIKSISMTTNGLLLADKVKQLKEAGLDSVNISLDSFKTTRFKAITGSNLLEKVLESIEVAKSIGLKVKINTVIIRGWNEDEIVNFAEFARTNGHIVRFIEFMPLDGDGIWQKNMVFSKNEMMNVIINNLGDIVPINTITSSNDSTNMLSTDPASLYCFADGKGIVGFIPSMTEPFCGNCDRIRLTSDGKLLTCLFEKPRYDMRNMLRAGRSDHEIKKELIANVRKKPEGIIRIISGNKLEPSLNMMHRIGG